MMTRDNLILKLAVVFQVSPDQLTDDASPKNISGWDSLAALGVISLLDDAGAGEISAEDVANFETIGAVVSFAKTRGILVN